MRLFIALLLLWPCCCLAETSWLKHIPPTIQANAEFAGEVNLVALAEGVKRARVLRVSSDGLQATEMEVRDKFLQAQIPFGDLAEVEYFIQYEEQDGELRLTKLYSVKQPSNEEFSDAISTLKLEQRSVLDQVSQLKDEIRKVRGVNVGVFAKSRSEQERRVSLEVAKKRQLLKQAWQTLERHLQSYLVRGLHDPAVFYREDSPKRVYKEF